MIQVSEKAKQVLVEKREAEGLAADKVHRLTQTEGGLGLTIDTEKADDTVIGHDDVPVLAVDQTLEAKLPDSLIDVEDTPSGPQLSIGRVA